MNRTIKAAALFLGATATFGTVGPATAMTSSAATVRSVGEAVTLPKVDVRGGIRYHELQSDRDGMDESRFGVFQAEVERARERPKESDL